MTISNDELIKKIKEFRKQAGKTQLELANHLGKTSAAISDLERGKVQVSASELSKIADFLDIPVNNFYDDLLNEKYIQDMIFLARKQPEETRAKSITMLNMIMDMNILTEKMQSNPDKELSPEEIGSFFTKLLTLSTQFKNMSIQLENLTQQIYQIINEQGISLPKP